MPKITAKSFDAYERFLSHVYATGMTPGEAVGFFKNLPIAEETVIKNYRAKTLGKIVRKYDYQNFLDGYNAWILDS